MILSSSSQSSGVKVDGLKNVLGPVKKGLLGSKNIVNMPIVASQIYLWGGFVLFMISANAFNLNNPILLVLFVTSAHIALFFGYRIGITHKVNNMRTRVFENGPKHNTLALLILAGSLYFFIYGIAYLKEYGATGLFDILSTVKNQGNAYANKFEIYEDQLSQGRVNSVIQIIVLLGALQTILVPLLVVFWERISKKLKLIAFTSISLYLLFYLYIGTMKGIGDLVIYLIVGFLVKRGRSLYLAGTTNFKKKSLINPRVFTIALILAFFVFMSNNMQSRTEVLGNAITKERGLLEQVIYSLAGDELGLGVVTAIGYPTSSYSGLDKNLSTPFEWTYGFGAMPALNSYKNQYIGGEDLFYKTYPARTEVLTGYPALMFWATIYPWLASDLTFPGAILFMVLVGWLMANFWIEAICYARPLSIALFGQMFLLIIFIPANNQIFVSRSSFVGFFTLLFLYIVTGRGKKKIVW